MRNLKVRKIILCALVCAILPLIKMDVEAAEPTDIRGSGSYQLNEVGTEYRFYTEYYVDNSGKSITSAGVQRKTTVYVYALAGEKILFGSSVTGSEIDENNIWTKSSAAGKDIVITYPDGVTKQSYDVTTGPGGKGYIADPTHEKFGPKIFSTDDLNYYYDPLEFTVPAPGVYTFEFHSVRGTNDGTTPTPVLAKSTAWNQKTTSVAAWDVTVVDGSNNVKKGRAWTNYLALTTGDGAVAKADLDVHVLTHDGYQYKVNFKEAAPFGFIFFANNTGFMTPVTYEGHTTLSSIYHSFYDDTNDLDHMTSKENIVLHKPNEADDLSRNLETYKIFFNEPNSDLSYAGIKTAPTATVTLSGLKFTGVRDNIAHSGHGGYFSFHSDGEAMITIRLDLRRAIAESKIPKEEYDGNGIVEITAPAVAGDNIFYWDGKDTEGIVIPPGIYGYQDVVLSSEIKRGELHFPVIDMEGLNGGLTVKRINGAGIGTFRDYDLYYNNNPLVHGTIEGNVGAPKAGYFQLSDGTNSYKVETTKGGAGFFPTGNQERISTLKEDTKDYVASKLFDSTYAALTAENKAIIDLEFAQGHKSHHFEPVNSNDISMTFSANGFYGGGDRAGIDAWTYYSQDVTRDVISFAVMDGADRGMIKGEIFYDGNLDSAYGDAKDHMLSNIKVRLIDSTGATVTHDEVLPDFDENGHFIYEADGTIKHSLHHVKFETVTGADGKYRFVGVPYDATTGTTYHVQVMLTEAQSEVLRYACTTSAYLKDRLKDNAEPANSLITGWIAPLLYGADGNAIEWAGYDTKVYGYKYKRNGNNEIEFSLANSQSITLDASVDPAKNENGIRFETFKKIGYCTAVPAGNRKNYKVVKKWGTDYKGYPTHVISDGVIVELWVWNDKKEQDELKLTRRTGALIDTQVLIGDNASYTWYDLDDRLQYYVMEYYIKKKPNGEEMLDDEGNPRKVLIGGTLPVYGTDPGASKPYYGFIAKLGDYPGAVPDPADSSIMRIPVQYFNDGASHDNSITDTEKLESVENNARQYKVTYKLTTEGTDTNVITVTNSQMIDDKTYYVWLDHESILPDMVGETYVDGGERKSHALSLVPDGAGSNIIKGMSVTSVDAANADFGNTEGNATAAFEYNPSDPTSVKFTATNHGNYKSGTGTRTYRVKYVVDSVSKNPVEVVASGDALYKKGEITDPVEKRADCIVYSWYMTIHVYDVVQDGVFGYNPSGGSVTLQTPLPTGTQLSWTLWHDGINHNSITYKSNDGRGSGLLFNDVLRVPLYKDAVHPDMGTCADLVAVAYAGSSTVADIKDLDNYWEDTYGTKFDSKTELLGVDIVDGQAIANGSSGYVKVDLNTPRTMHINRTQDHANYASVTYTPGNPGMMRMAGSDEEVFYYKIVVHAEDNTYEYDDYDHIDASQGVVMYAHFKMKPRYVPLNDDPDDTYDSDDGFMYYPGAQKPKDKVDQTVDGIAPDSGDYNCSMLLSILSAAIALLLVGVLKRTRHADKAN